MTIAKTVVKRTIGIVVGALLVVAVMVMASSASGWGVGASTSVEAAKHAEKDRGDKPDKDTGGDRGGKQKDDDRGGHGLRWRG